MKNQDAYGQAYVYTVTALITALIMCIPVTLCIALWAKLAPEAIALFLAVGVVATGFALEGFWKAAVPQNAEYTNTLARNPDGSMTAVTQAGPMYLRPGATIEGNQISRDVRAAELDLEVVLQDGVTIIIKGQVRWCFSDQKAKLEEQNRLGTFLDKTVENALRDGFENAADIVSATSPTYINLRAVLNARGLFLASISDFFRASSEVELEESLGIEIFDDKFRGIQLSLKMTEAIQKILNEQYQDDRENVQIDSLAEKMISRGVNPQEAYDQATATIKGSIQRFSGKGARAVPFVSNQPPQDDGE